MILKEAGGRLENSAGSINSKDNMFAGSSGNAISDKIGGSGNTNPIENPNEGKEGTEETTTVDTSTTETTTTPETDTSTDVSTDTETFSDENLKSYQEYRKNYGSSGGSNKGKLKNLDLNPMSQKSVTSNDSNGGGGMGAMTSMFKGLMGADSAGGGADVGADSGVDASDMSDMGDMADAGDAADAACDTRLKNIFGDNEDAIKAFAKINAIEFTYNDKAKEIPDGEKKGIDDDVHYGVKAQEIAENPLTASAVKKDPISDYLQIDIKELTTANTAIISEICKRILIIEKVLGIKVV